MNSLPTFLAFISNNPEHSIVPTITMRVVSV